MRCVSNVFASTAFLPVRTSISFAHTPALMWAASVKICNALAPLAFNPFPLTDTAPCSTR